MLSFPSHFFSCECYARGDMTHVWVTVWLPQHKKCGQEEMLALTSAGPAPSADTECHGAFPTHGGGFQHSLHVLVLSSILGILQALGLALAGRGAAAELAGLWGEKDLLFQLRTAWTIGRGLDCELQGKKRPPRLGKECVYSQKSPATVAPLPEHSL